MPGRERRHRRALISALCQQRRPEPCGPFSDLVTLGLGKRDPLGVEQQREIRAGENLDAQQLTAFRIDAGEPGIGATYIRDNLRI